ncbi:hypothetical protein [Micromonospora sp. RTGN7]|uniref:hypothetical protein n=1 Tax=Micromonospora sp. RTGN7 TaxID=3016526 RepID=UPI0029FF190F|nr:hypothetical protein [Micromonospora sp. RTGN7]
MSPRQVIAAITRRSPGSGPEPDPIEQWVDGLRTTTPAGALADLATTAPVDPDAVLAATRKEQA